MTIAVKWGQSVDGYGLARAAWSGNRLHLVSWDNEPYDYTAVCGKRAIDSPTQWASGTLCPTCAKATGVKSADDLAVDEEEYGYMQAQKD